MTTPSQQTIPYGTCHCGCGQKTSLASQTMKCRGWVAGLPIRFLPGHQGYKRRPIESAKPFKIDGDYCRLIPLTRGLFAIVDEADYLSLMKFRWHAVPAHSGRYHYAARMLRVDRKQHAHSMHRQILGLSPGDILEGDHIRTGETLDNRRSNLRVAERFENAQNKLIPANNSSGFKGVDYIISEKRYRARIMFRGKRIQLGGSKTAEGAAQLYLAGARKYHKEFANDGENWISNSGEATEKK